MKKRKKGLHVSYASLFKKDGSLDQISIQFSTDVTMFTISMTGSEFELFSNGLKDVVKPYRDNKIKLVKSQVSIV